MENFLFYLFSLVAIFSAIQVIWSRNPVQSVLYLVLVFVNATGLLLLLEVEFMAMIFLIVYVGAIAVLFLFVVMMLAPKIADDGIFARTRSGESLALAYLPVGLFLAALFMAELYLILNGDLLPLEKANLISPPDYVRWISIYDGVGSSTSNLESLGQVLYTFYFYDFLLAGFVLLLAMIGAIVLTLQTREGSSMEFLGQDGKRQQVFEQLSRDSGRAIFNVKTVKSLLCLSLIQRRRIFLKKKKREEL